jgi:hypothetical protein
MKYEAQRNKIKKLSAKLLDIKAAFKFEQLEIVRSAEECVDDEKVYLLIDFEEEENDK